MTMGLSMSTERYSVRTCEAELVESTSNAPVSLELENGKQPHVQPVYSVHTATVELQTELT